MVGVSFAGVGSMGAEGGFSVVGGSAQPVDDQD